MFIDHFVTNARKLLFISTCLIPLLSFGGEPPPDVKMKLSHLTKGETLPVIVYFTRSPDIAQFKFGRASAPHFITYLKNSTASYFTQLQAALSQMNYTGRVIELWITNSAALDATKALAETISNLPFVERIVEDEQFAVTGDSFSDAANFTIAGYNPGWNIKKIGADSVWQQYEINGSGILIGSMDTGVDTTHPSIITKWKRGAYVWYYAISGNKTPYDDDGHGTHTTGTLVGGDGPGSDTNDVGVAYGATLIAAKMLTSGFASIAQVTGAAQWMLDPDGNSVTNDFPDVINNSWFSNTRGSTWFADVAATWRVAGIIPVFCAANFGPATSSTRSPADYAICISVGGTNSVDNRYIATSVGPSPEGSVFPADRRKPDVSAPGEGVRSCSRGGGFTLSSGTSMATPHVTGTIALMLQANPTLSYEEVFRILQHTSIDLGDPGYDYVFGYGRIDALKAVREALKLRFEVILLGDHHTSETGDSVITTIGLRIQPVSPVQVHIQVSDQTEATVAPDSVIQFTPENWSLAQAALIRGIPDSITDGDVSYQVTARTQSDDLLYNELSVHIADLINDDVTTLIVNENNTHLKSFVVYQNYPNPFNPTTTISFEIIHSSFVTLKIFDLLGREITTLANEQLNSGFYAKQWDASNTPGGIYYYRLQAGGYSATNTLLVQK